MRYTLKEVLDIAEKLHICKTTVLLLKQMNDMKHLLFQERKKGLDGILMLHAHLQSTVIHQQYNQPLINAIFVLNFDN